MQSFECFFEHKLEEGYWGDLQIALLEIWKGGRTMNGVDILKGLIMTRKTQGDPDPIATGKKLWHQAIAHGLLTKDQLPGSSGDMYRLAFGPIKGDSDQWNQQWSNAVRLGYGQRYPNAKLPQHADAIHSLAASAYRPGHEAPDYDTARRSGNLGPNVSPEMYDQQKNRFNDALGKFGFANTDDAMAWNQRIRQAGRQAYGKPYRSFQ